MSKHSENTIIAVIFFLIIKQQFNSKNILQENYITFPFLNHKKLKIKFPYLLVSVPGWERTYNALVSTLLSQHSTHYASQA